MQPSKPGPQYSARARTDSSLQKERTKVDQVIADSLTSQADEALDGVREEADAAKSQQRDATDATRDAVSPELIQEREVTDSTLDVERREADLAIERERTLRKASERARHYSAERLMTNHDLAVERQKLDQEIEESTWLLSEERAAHDDTRVALTTRDEFLAIVSHDLRSPLSAVLAGTAILTGDPMLGPVNGRSRRMVDGIRRNAAAMLRLIDDLLDVERVAAGKLELMYKDHDLRRLARQAFETFEPLAAEKGLTLSLELGNSSLVVSCDGDRIMQVLGNLVGNAIKFTPAGGAVVISVTSAGGWAQVSVADTGQGIPIEARSRIFERFSQLPSAERTGLGLGLYIARSIVSAHEGQLWVASAVGEGSVFSFALRMAP